MSKWMKISAYMTIGLGALSVMWLVFNIIAFEIIRPVTLNFEIPCKKVETLSVFVALGLMVFFIFHISAVLTTVYHMQCFGGENTFRRITLFFGIISFMSIFADVGLLSDIGKE